MGPTAKYFASGFAKYQPLTAAVGYIAKLSVILQIDGALDVEHLPQRALLGVIRAGGISRRRADAAIDFRDQLLVGQALFGRVTPQLAAHAQVQRFGRSFREAIRQRLQQDVVVVVMRRFEALEMLLDADAGRDGERADVVDLAAESFGAMKSDNA